MGLLHKFNTPLRADEGKGPADDFWYSPFPGTTSVSGVRIDADTALSVSTVFACLRILMDNVGMLPLSIKENLTKNGKPFKQDARNHPLWDVLHNQPNNWQTAMEYKGMLMGHALMRGNFYAQIMPGPRGFADQLIPLNPDRMVKVELLADFTKRYTYNPVNGPQKVFFHDEIHHIVGPYSDDGIVGKSLLSMARDSFGTTVGAEQYAGRFYSQNMRPQGVFKKQGVLSKDAHDRLKADLRGSISGLDNVHSIPILEDGLEWQSIGLTNEDAQFLQSRGHQVEEIARWFGVPLMLLQHTEKATSWGTGIEQMMQGFVTITLMPWLVRIEQAITRDLILNRQRFFPKFNVDMLLRGDTKSRYEAHRIAIMAGFKTRNEARDDEDDNPLEGLDEPLVALNMASVDENGNIIEPNQASQAAPDVAPTDDRAEQFATNLARISVGRERALLRKISLQYSGDPAKMNEELENFYRDQVMSIVDNFNVEPDEATAYYERQKANPEATEEDRIADLVGLALGDGNDD